MNRQVFPLWIFLVVAVAIAGAAFGAAQIARGSGTIVVLALTALWMIFVQVRARRLTNG